MDKYGIIERVWTDRRYEDPASLKAAAEAMLRQLQEPTVSYEIGYQEMTASDFDKAAIGKRLRIVFPEIGETVDTFITEIRRDHEDVERSSIVVANRETSIASSLADMADRQRIEQTYAQGATQIYSQALQANCDSKSGAVMDFFIPGEMRIINKVLVKVRVSKFRAYSKSTESTQQQEQTSSSGGGCSTTSSSGGGCSTTSSSGGGSTVTSQGGGGSTTDTGPGGINVEYGELSTSMTDGHSHRYSRVTSHQHEVRFEPHDHTVTIQDHDHTVDIPDHDHTVDIPDHDHTVTIPAHAHEIMPGIFEFGDPARFGLYVNGRKKADFEGRTAELDVTKLLIGQDNMIPRGSWLSLEVRPDDLAYVSMDLIVQGFVQSRGDNTV